LLSDKLHKRNNVSTFELLKPYVGNVVLLNDRVFIYEDYDILLEGQLVLVLAVFDIHSVYVYKLAPAARASNSPTRYDTEIRASLAHIYYPRQNYTKLTWVVMGQVTLKDSLKRIY